MRKGKNFIKYVNRLREKDKEAGSLGSLKTKIKKGLLLVKKSWETKHKIEQKCVLVTELI